MRLTWLCRFLVQNVGKAEDGNGSWTKLGKKGEEKKVFFLVIFSSKWPIVKVNGAHTILQMEPF